MHTLRGPAQEAQDTATCALPVDTRIVPPRLRVGWATHSSRVGRVYLKVSETGTTSCSYGDVPGLGLTSQKGDLALWFSFGG